MMGYSVPTRLPATDQPSTGVPETNKKVDGRLYIGSDRNFIELVSWIPTA